MKKITFLLLTFFSLFLYSCGIKSDRFKISGKFLHMNQAEFYIYSPDGVISGIDTIQISGGEIDYEIPCHNEGTLVIIFPNFSQQPIFAEPGTSVTIKADASHLKELKVEGSEANELMNHFREMILNVSPPEMIKKAEIFIKDHPESIVSTYLVRTYFLDKSYPDYTKAAELLKQMEAAQPKNGYIKRMTISLQQLKNAKEQANLPHFTAYDTEGKMFASSTLSSAPYAVINVWTSSDFESQNLQRFLKSIQQKSQGKLKLMSICVDASKKDCQQTMKRDSINWPNICDQDMFDGKTIKTLGLTSLPGNLLLKDGKIIARDLKSQDLRDRLNKIFP